MEREREREGNTLVKKKPSTSSISDPIIQPVARLGGVSDLAKENNQKTCVGKPSNEYRSRKVRRRMTTHYSIDLGYPIYCCSFIDPDKIALGGGGGTTKSGITNKISVVELNSSLKSSDSLSNFNLEKGDDVPMSMDFDRSSNQLICGINAPSISSNPEQNLHLRAFSLDKNHQLKATSSQRVLTYDSDDNYQRITCLSDNQRPKFLAVGGTNNQLDILSYPNLKPAFSTIWCDQDDPKSQLIAADFHEDGSQFLVGSSRRVKLFSTKIVLTSKNHNKNSKQKKNKKASPKMQTTQPAPLIRELIPPQSSKSDRIASFRNAKFGRGLGAKMLYTIVNELPSNNATGGGGRRTNQSVWGRRSDQKKAILTSWNLVDGTPRRTKVISTKPVTSFDISPSGRFVAFSSSDLSIGIMDAFSLRSLLSILHAHQFPVTCIKFSPDEKRVISCSADMSIRVIELDQNIEGRSSRSFTIFICLIILLIAVLIKFLFK